MLILQGLRERYEEHHGVTITDEALRAAAELSDRYIQDRNLPDKAIDLIDEASAKIKIGAMMGRDVPDRAMQAELESLRRQREKAVANEEFEQAHLLKEKEDQLLASATKEKKVEVAAEAVAVVADSTDIDADADVAKAGENKIKQQLVVNEEDIAEIISMWTGIPVFKMTQAEGDRLVNMEEALHNRLIGQHEAVSAVSRAIRRSRTGMKDPKRPMGSFVFLGPTGVGKTELARTLASYLFNDENSLIKFDMSSYGSQHDVAALLGSPPGYVGYDDKPGLEIVRRKPYSVVLFDEIEKAHSSIFDIFLQILEEGKIVLAQGRVVDFSNTIVIMTSNVGAMQITNKPQLGFSTGDASSDYSDMKSRVMSELKKVFRPELLNRLDETVVFHQLVRSEIAEILELLLHQLTERIAGQGFKLEVSAALREKLLDEGYDRSYGARPMKRAIQRLMEDAIADAMLGKAPAYGSTLVADIGDDGTTMITVKEANILEPVTA